MNNLKTKISQALYGINQCTNVIGILRGNNIKQTLTYEFKGLLLIKLASIMIPKDLKIYKEYELITANKSVFKNSTKTYRFVECKTLGEVLMVLQLLVDYLGENIE